MTYLTMLGINVRKTPCSFVFFTFLSCLYCVFYTFTYFVLYAVLLLSFPSFFMRTVFIFYYIHIEIPSNENNFNQFDSSQIFKQLLPLCIHTRRQSVLRLEIFIPFSKNTSPYYWYTQNQLSSFSSSFCPPMLPI